jgi:hypothetical protein
MLQLWKAHGHALCEEFHKKLDARPFTLCHGDSSSETNSDQEESSSLCWSYELFHSSACYTRLSRDCLDKSIVFVGGKNHFKRKGCCCVAFLCCIHYCIGDLRADNLFRLGANGEATAFKIIDWQTYSSAPPGADMTQMVTTNS